MAMSADSIPVIDLRLLSQSDINAIALSSPNAFNLDTLSDVVPKIDRSVFNESAGSRKQTYSRLPLFHQSHNTNTNPNPNSQLPHHPNPQTSQPQSQPTNPTLPRRRGRPRLQPMQTAHLPAAGPAAEEPDLGRQENLQIVSILKKLFKSRENGSKTNDNSTTSHNKNVENNNVMAVVSDVERDREVHNGKGEVVDLVGMAVKEDLFGEEIRRRTDGLQTEEQLLGYMTGLDGQWGSRRKKRKVVDAAVFGDALPKGWKLLLGLKRKDGIVYMNCRRYVSPSGRQFASCKEVSSYILSLNGHQDAAQPISGQHDNHVSRTANLTLGRVAGLTHQDGNTNEMASRSFVSPISHTESKKQKGLFRVKKQAVSQPDNGLECLECNMTFGDKDARLQHMSTFHQRSAKRRKLGKSLTDGVIVKDGKYECQFCHKAFTERHRYNGHIGAHIRYEGLGVDASPHDISTRASNDSSPLSIVPSPSEMNIPADKTEEAYTTKSVNDKKHIGSPQRMMEADSNGVKHDPEASEHAITEAVSSDCKHEIEHSPKAGGPEITEAASSNNRIEHDPDEGASKAVSRESKTEHDSEQGIPEITKTVAVENKVEHDPHEGIPEIADDVSKSEFVDRQSEDCKINREKSIEVIEARNATDTTFNACTDVIYPCGIAVNNASHTLSPITTQEPSTSKRVHDQINGGEISGDKGLVIEDNVEDVEPNICVKSIALTLAVDATTCETISEADLSLKSKIVNVNINDHIMTGYNLDNDANIGNAMGIEIAEEIDHFSSKDKFVDEKINEYDVTCYKSAVVDTTDAMSIEDNACMDALSPSLIDVDNTSYENPNAIDPVSENYNGDSKISEDGHMLSLSGNGVIRQWSENYNGDPKISEEGHMLSLSGTGLSYCVETYASDIIASKEEEHVELDASIHGRSNTGSCEALTSKDTGIASTMHSELSTSYIFANIANEPTSGIETNADCMFSGDLNKSLLDGIDRVGNEFQNYFHSSNGCTDDASGTIMNNGDGRQALHVNMDNRSSSWLQSSNTIPNLDLIPDQCQEEFHRTVPRSEQANISDFGDLRLGSIEPADFVLFSGQPSGASGSVTRSPMELFPDDQLEWGMSLTKMVPTSVSTSVCVWCSREFSLEGVQSEPQSESLGYMCPDCKAKISGQLGLLNNGFS